MSNDDLLPANATPLERSISGAGARMLSVDSDAIRAERLPAQCGAQFVPFLAWERSVHFYDPLDEAGNRARIETSFEDHLNYGSPAALEAEIALDTGQTVRIVEWFEEPDLAWPDFAVLTLIDPGQPAPDLAALTASALARKNVRDWPAPRVFGRQPVGGCVIGAASGVVLSAKILSASKPPANAFIGAASGFVLTAKILPLGAHA